MVSPEKFVFKWFLGSEFWKNHGISINRWIDRQTFYIKRSDEVLAI